MNANQVKNMVTRVPTIRRSVPIESFNVSHYKDNFYYNLIDFYRLKKVQI